MRKLFFTLAIFVMALYANAQTDQHFWLNGRLMFGSQIAQTDSITFSSSKDLDTLHLILPRTAMIVQKETLYLEVHDTVYITRNICPTEGALAGEFSVSATKKVRFSKGNLQYQASSNTWRFVENFSDFIKLDNRYATADYDGWIDLFGWGTSGYDNTANDPFAINYQPWAKDKNTPISKTYTIHGDEIESINCEMQSITGRCDTIWENSQTYLSDNTNYYGYGPSLFMADKNLTGTSASYDWGVYNAISNGGNEVDVWRTMTIEEWDYLLSSRPLAIYLRSQAKVCGLNGYIILPDNFVLPNGLNWNYQASDWTTNLYDSIAWNKMEDAGAIFLPAAGYRTSSGGSFGSNGYYWSASYIDKSASYVIYFDSNTLTVRSRRDRSNRYSVRLVQDAN